MTKTAEKSRPGRKPGQSTVAPELTGVSASVAMPARPAASRGSKSIYPFDELTAAGMSFGVKNKTAEQIASIVSNQNKRNRVPAKDANGALIFETTTAKAPDGTDITVPTDKPKMVAGKTFFAYDVDPAQDPDGATVRVFRDA